MTADRRHHRRLRPADDALDQEVSEPSELAELWGEAADGPK
ncbi:hypothetical protein ACFWVF_28155 [Streptomyces sp. NPDC058659]